MTVQFLKNRLSILIFLILNVNSFAQLKVDTCNREVKLKSYEKDLIKEVCIPLGYLIFSIETKHTDIDINGDSIPDFIFDWTKKNRREGDTTFITAYKMNPDSSYTFLKTFNNLIPIDLDSYDKPSNNPYLADLWSDCYHSSYPLRYVNFIDGRIELNITTEPRSGIEFFYKYSKDKNNWILQNIRSYFDSPSEGRLYEAYPMPSTEETIDDFSYEKYLCPERLIKE